MSELLLMLINVWKTTIPAELGLHAHIAHIR